MMRLARLYLHFCLVTGVVSCLYGMAVLAGAPMPPDSLIAGLALVTFGSVLARAAADDLSYLR